MNIRIDEDIDILFKDLDRDNKIFVLTDDNVYSIYRDYIEEKLRKYNGSIFIMESGEVNKNKDIIFQIYDKMIENDMTRQDVFMALGGGVVGDMGGFVASTYMRGIKYIQIPTTLLAQVDSSVGGKTGFDYGGYKNIIGTFNYPDMTYIDTRFLESLDTREILSGLGEILKYGLINDYEFFIEVSNNYNNIFSKDLDLLRSYVGKSVETKLKFVKDDFKDLGKRKELNFGHTVGHSIESFFDFGRFTHGEAVILGMMYETRIAYILNMVDAEYCDEVISKLSELVRPIKFNDEEILKLLYLMKKDKKNTSAGIAMVLPIERAMVKFFEKIDNETIRESLKGDWIEDNREK